MNLFGFSSQSIRNFLTIALFVSVLFSCRDDEHEPQAPEVTGVNPSSALPNTLISITGKAFSPVFSENKVTFNGKDALVSNASETQLNVVVPVGAETGPISVTTRGKTAINQPLFTVESFPPVVTSISPTTGGYNTMVTITGSNFSPTIGNNAITFNGVPGIVESATTTSLTVKVPARAGSGTVVVNGFDTGIKFNYVPDIFIAGYQYDNAGQARATYWKNGIPTILSGPGQYTYANGIVVVNDDVYVSGYRHIGVYAVARWWKNGTEMPLTDDAHSSIAEGIFAVGSDVYVTSNEESSAGKNKVRYWKNGTPADVTDGTANAYGYGIAVNGQDVYAVGNSPHANGNTVATYWKNGTPHLLTSGVSFAWDIFVSGDDVYTTGSIRNTGPGVGFVAYWKNDTAVLLGPGLGSGAGWDIVVVGNDVYVAGVEDNVKSIGVAKYWKNGVPVVLTDGAYQASANAIDVVGEDVYVAGVESNASGTIVAKYWKNGVPFAITDGGYFGIAQALVLR